MKRLNTIPFLVLLCLGFPGVNSSLGAEEKKQEAGHTLIGNIQEIDSLTREVKKVGSVPGKCPGCADKDPNLKVVLDKKTVDIGRPYYMRDNEPYVVYVKRTSETPGKVDLTLKNGHRYCEKPYFGTNQLSGAVVMDCLLYLTRYEDEEISLNLKNLPLLKAGEEDLIEVKFYKKDINSAKYTIEAKHFGEPSMKEDIDSKFFGNGFNIGFKAAEKDK